jgi:photosystem II stability/assembly factor-like uncharacterized protein
MKKTLQRSQSGKSYKSDKSVNFFSSLIFYLSILFFLIGFNFTDSPPAGGWYQQFMPNIGNRQITDITFLDSLTGYAIASISGDTDYVMKTTNRGDTWQIVYRNYLAMTRVQFLNLGTGYVCGGYLYKTTDGGFNWSQLITPAVSVEEMFVLNKDTIWFVNSNSLVGGVFFTPNGGVSWQQQLNLGSQNPTKIYMYNARIGFVSSTAGLYKTTNGSNWFFVSNDFSFSDMFFIDSLIGWKASGFIKKTTNGGVNWVNQPLPTGNFLGQGIVKLMNTDNDTIWAVGEALITGGSPPARGILYRTTNGGINWLFQIPDTSIHIVQYWHGKMIYFKYGWGYHVSPTGIHTTTGGNDTFYTPVKQISWNVPKDFKLFNNYPNPFNPETKIGYELKVASYVKLIVYDITGKIIDIHVDEKQEAGRYETVFNGSELSSGIYFFKIQIQDEKGGVIYVETKRAILIK